MVRGKHVISWCSVCGKDVRNPSYCYTYGDSLLPFFKCLFPPPPPPSTKSRDSPKLTSL